MYSLQIVTKLRRVLLTASMAIGLAATTPVGAQARASADFDLPAQPLEMSLRQIADSQKLQMVYTRPDLERVNAPAVKGRYTVEEAVAKATQGTGLVATFTRPDTVVIKPAAEKGGQAENPTRLAQAQSAERREAASAGERTDRSAIQLGPITVTAQKRSEFIQDVPVPVTAIEGARLTERNQLRFQDYFSNFPSLNFASGTRDDTFPVIRSLTTGAYTNPTVGTVVDDVPYGASIGNVPAPDIDPSDLQRIEVLRGPQGTLYGANSLGGLIKYVTADPSVRAFTGRVEAGTSSVRNGSQLGYMARAAVNIPVSETLAVRASGFTRSDPGFIDNPVRGLEGLNEGRAAGAHLAALWSPSDDFSLKLSALIQRSSADGNSFFFVDPPFRDFQQNYLPNSTGYERRDETFAATIKARLGGMDLTSISSYSNYDHLAKADISVVFAALAQRAFGPNVTGTYFDDTLTVRKFAQEVRLFSAGSRFDWLLGGFLTRESNGHPTDYWAVDPATLATQFFGHSDVPLKYREYAVFANLTFHVTDRFDVQLGGRQSRIKQDESVQTHTGAFATVRFGGNPFVVTAPAADDKPTTYLFAPQYRLSPDLMVYLRLASGFQPGGINIGVNVPPTYKSNTTENYEIGLKGKLPGRPLTFDISLYRIDWKDLPTVFFNSATSSTYRVNSGEARSEGIEVSLEAVPLQGLAVAGWFSVGNAKLTQAVAPGVVGDRLPYSTKFSSNLSIDQRFSLAEGVGAVAGVAWNHVGERLGNLGTRRQVFPAYSRVDLRFGVDFRKWKANAFINNVADRRGAVGGGLDAAFAPFPILYIQPRTIGVTVSRSF